MTQHCVRPWENTTGHPRHSETLPRLPESAAAALRIVRTALTAWGQERLIENAELITTELVSNAVNHGRMDAIRVIVSRPTERCIRVGVVDRSKALPMMRMDTSEEATQGRGLLLVDALSDRWGTDLYRWGKQVWGELKAEVAS